MIKKGKEWGEFPVDRLERELVQAILSGTFRANDFMPSTERLCERYGLGFNVVRSAVGRLMSRGLLTYEPGSGVRVVELQSALDLKLLLDVIELATDEPERRWTLLAQLCGFLRFTLGEIVDRAAQHRDGDQLEWLQHLVRLLEDRQQLRADRHVLGNCELQVIRMYAAASGCVGNTAVVNSLRAFFTGELLTHEARPLMTLGDHWGLLEAVTGRDSTGARAILEAAWWHWEAQCIDELKKLGWSETSGGPGPT